ncbi:hypothetical protein EAH89_21325 [Roseomonas nepalensis]|uniref:Uncharacterized protein n=1 Tax=Muricoccus nepalensis TaxID=1854500 RepID=A0A502FKC5_9PROT|nr:hypothetical protein [Roseomonas nepalensis]TPG49553.1 hypothetical protein EAH89_21325 [Roseomonas nepalensis]
MSPARRNLLGGLAALAGAPALPHSAGSTAGLCDATLIAKCGEVIAAHEACVASYCYPINATPAQAKPYEEMADHYAGISFEAAEVAAQLPATTLAGLLAKAQAALAIATTDRDGQFLVSDNAEWLAIACLEDLVRFADGAA